MLRARVHKLVYGPRRATQQYLVLNRIELRRAAALHNLRLVQRQHPGASIMLVLKANAYGHGLAEMADILNGADCDFLAVDGYFEAAKLRYVSRHRLLVLGYVRPENVHLLDTKRCSFVVQDAAGLEAFGHLHRPVRVHLELNTGMNRLGLQPDEVDQYLATLKKFPNLRLEGIMTHLADADNESNDDFTQRQVATFDAQVEHILAQGFRPKYIHAAQTAGSTKVKSKYANGIRLGIGLYGINPLAAQDPQFQSLEKLRPVLELKTTIIKTLDLKPGDKVSYNGIFTAQKVMRIGVLPLGYYEGLPRELSGAGCATHGQQILPIVGRVCMNHTMIDLKNSNLQTGDEVVLISGDPKQPNSIAEIVRRHNLFSYSLLTNLSSTIRRQIV